MNRDAKIYVAGHQGLVGSALMRQLTRLGYRNLVTRTFAECDLRNQQAVIDFFARECPEYVFLAAARVGGIHANRSRPAEFMYDNLAIEMNVIHAAYLYTVKKLIFLGSSCIYPRDAQQPIRETALLTGPLEPTNAPYAIAKISGIALCQAYNKQYGTNFICAMPTNLYGPGDNFDTMQGHVIPALIAKFCDAVAHKKEEVIVWGTGQVYREFMYVDDCAQALIFLMHTYNGLPAVASGFDKLTMHGFDRLTTSGFDRLTMSGFDKLTMYGGVGCTMVHSDTVTHRDKARHTDRVTHTDTVMDTTTATHADTAVPSDPAMYSATATCFPSIAHPEPVEGLANSQECAWINIGTGHDIKIEELVYTVARITGFKGAIVWDASFPDGTPRKRLDVAKINGLGWNAQTSLEDGLVKTVAWYKTRVQHDKTGEKN